MTDLATPPVTPAPPAAPPAMPAKSATLAARLADLTVVADGDAYVLGAPHSPDFVAVPAIGGEVVLWLRDGLDLAECTARAAERMGEPVDVAGFIAGLAEAGLLPPETPATTPGSGATATSTATQNPPASVRTGRIRLGRALFGPVGLSVQGILAATVPFVLASVPGLRPSYRDLVIGPVPVLSIIVISVVAIVSAGQHELAHWLAASALGVPSRITMSRRLVTLVLQTDLTRLWGVPRRKRVVPLVAGMLSDAATTGVLLLLAAALPPDPLLDQAVRTVALLKLTGIVTQFLVFMRTDVYALYVLATRSRNLWDLKGALARRVVGRPTPADTALLAAATPRERRWAGVYLTLYLPGLAWTAWYTARYGLPATERLVGLSLHAITSAGLASATGAAGVLALAITVGTTGFLLLGLLRSGWRLGRALAAPRPAGHPGPDGPGR